jgi:hypothetical protein
MRHVPHMEGMRNACKIFVSEAEVKRAFTKLKHRYEDNTKMDLKSTVFENFD